MKKILLFIFLLSAWNLQAQQACVPGTLTAPQDSYILPDSVTGLDHACEGGGYYEQIIYIKVAKDTPFVFNGISVTAQIDSFVLDSNVIGMPSYINIEAVPEIKAPTADVPYKHIVVEGDSMACIKLSGNVPAGTTPAEIPLTINIRAYLTEPNFGISIDTLFAMNTYSFVIDSYGVNGCFPDSRMDLDASALQVQAYPNPSTSFTNLKINTVQANTAQIIMLDPLGRVVMERMQFLPVGDTEMQIDMSRLPSAAYRLRVITPEGENQVMISKL